MFCKFPKIVPDVRVNLHEEDHRIVCDKLISHNDWFFCNFLFLFHGVFLFLQSVTVCNFDLRSDSIVKNLFIDSVSLLIVMCI